VYIIARPVLYMCSMCMASEGRHALAVPFVDHVHATQRLRYTGLAPQPLTAMMYLEHLVCTHHRLQDPDSVCFNIRHKVLILGCLGSSHTELAVLLWYSCCRVHLS
jgi:hypothetical protein